MNRRREWMRRSVLLVAAAVGAVALAGPAGAQDTTSTTVAEAESAGTSWPVTLLALVAFVGVGWFSIRIVRRSFETAARNRALRVGEQQAAVTDAITEREAIRQQYAAQIRQASAEVDRIIEEQREHAARVGAEATREGRDRLEAVRAASAAEAESLRSAAVSDVRDEAAQLAADLAKALTKADVDTPEARRLIDGYLDQQRPPDRD